MAHKVLVDGTAYKVSGGRTLIDGTAYSIKNGKTLVGGTAYEVGFAEMVTVTITGSSSRSVAYVIIDGVTYTSATTLSVPVGTVIECYATSTGKDGTKTIYLNGSMVSNAGFYSHTIAGDTTIHLTQHSETDKDDEKYYYGTVSITEA